MPNPLSPTKHSALMQILEKRFLGTMPYHPGVSWELVKEKLEQAPEKLKSIDAMEASGGEPNVVSDPQNPHAVVFMDCSQESPAGRRSLCYDEEARLSRKSNAPGNSALHMAADMGIQLLSEAQYRTLQTLVDVDLKTSSWVQTPSDVRSLGGALFCDKRYGQVFVYHSGADSYYASRGFRGALLL